MNKSDSSIKVELVDDKKIEKGNLPDRSIRAYVNKEELNGLVDGQGGGDNMILSFEDYVDITTMAIKDLDGIKEAINAGKMFYMNENDESSAIVFDGLYNGSISNDHIILTGVPLVQENQDMEGGAILGIKLFFNKDTGIIDVTKSAGSVFNFVHSVDDNGVRQMKMGKLEIGVDGTTYEYDGSQDVDIDISSGSGGGTYVYPLCFTKGDDDKSSGGGAYWDDLLNAITNDIPIAVEYYLSSDTSSLPAKCVAYVNSVRDTGDYTQGGGRVRKLYLSVRCAGTSKTDPCVDQLITVAKYYDQGNTVETTVDVIS